MLEQMMQKDENKETKKLKPLEEAVLIITMFDNDDIVVASGDCLASGTKITLEDGSIKNIDDISEGDVVMAFDHEAGCLVGSEVLYAYKGDAPRCPFTLTFANGATLSIVGEHDLFEQESCRYVTIAAEDAEQFIGKHFYSVAEGTYVELVGVVHETEAVEYFELYTRNNFNIVANGMLNVADDVDYLLNIYEFDENLQVDVGVLARDVQKYGLLEYNSKYGFSEEEYRAWNMAYVKIAVGKGLITTEELWQQHVNYVEQRERKVLAVGA